MNGAGNIAGLIDEVLPAAEVVPAWSTRRPELLGSAGHFLA